MEVWIDGRRLGQKLSVLEFKLLGCLYARANAVCSRDEIGTELWGDGAYIYEMLHQLVHRLKRRLEPDPAIPRTYKRPGTDSSQDRRQPWIFR